MGTGAAWGSGTVRGEETVGTAHSREKAEIRQVQIPFWQGRWVSEFRPVSGFAVLFQDCRGKAGLGKWAGLTDQGCQAVKAHGCPSLARKASPFLSGKSSPSQSPKEWLCPLPVVRVETRGKGSYETRARRNAKTFSMPSCPDLKGRDRTAVWRFI